MKIKELQMQLYAKQNLWKSIKTPGKLGENERTKQVQNEACNNI